MRSHGVSRGSNNNYDNNNNVNNQPIVQNCVRLHLANVRSLLTNTRQMALHDLIYENSENRIFALTETWLNDSVPDSLIDPKLNFHVVRNDRKLKRGGGVLLLIPKHFRYILNKEYTITNKMFEMVSVTIYINRVPINVSAVYRPPNNIFDDQDEAKFISSLSFLLSMNVMSIVLGDLNFPGINWTSGIGSSKIERTFVEMFHDSGACQIVNFGTRGSNILDVVLINNPDFVVNCQKLEAFGESLHHPSDHNSIEIFTNLAVKRKNVFLYKYNYRLAKWGLMESIIGKVSWSIFFSECSNANDMYLKLKAFIHYFQKHCVPKQKISIYKTNQPKWSKRVINMNKNAIRLKYKFRQSRNEAIKHKRKLIIKRMNYLKRKEISEQENKILQTKDGKKFWNFVRSKMKTKRDLPVLQDTNGALLFTDNKKVEAFSKYFESVMINDNNSCHFAGNRIVDSITNCSFDEAVVFKQMSTLNSKTSAGIDEIPNILLKKLKHVLCEPLSIIFRVSFATGIVPEDWKIAVVTPLPKTQSLEPDIKNYRPISLTSNVCKLMEKVIKTQLVSHLERNDILYENQYGFTSRKSCEIQLLASMNEWTKSVEASIPVDIVYLDYSKAFDTVVTSKLVYKLEQLGIRGNFLQWIESYLSHRLQFVKLNDARSVLTEVKSGVPQGSILGPILFNLFINDLPTAVRHNNIYLYADDAKLFGPVSTLQEKSNFQEDLNNIYKWSELNQLALAPHKCNILHLLGKKNPHYVFSINNIPLTVVDTINDLGVVIDSDLSMNPHLEQVISKCNRTIGIIKRCFRNKPIPIILKLYKAHVLPVALYCSSLWQPNSLHQWNRFENIQRNFSRWLCLKNGMDNTSYASRLDSLKLQYLSHQKLVNDQIILFKLLRGLVFCPSQLKSAISLRIKLNNTRGHLYQIERVISKNKIRRSFLTNRAAGTWNSLGSQTVTLRNCKHFKNALNLTEMDTIRKELYPKFFSRFE